MKISELISELQITKEIYGDLPLSTFDGFVYRIDLDPLVDGIAYPIDHSKVNEICIEIFTR